MCAISLLRPLHPTLAQAEATAGPSRGGASFNSAALAEAPPTDRPPFSLTRRRGCAREVGSALTDSLAPLRDYPVSPSPARGRSPDSDRRHYKAQGSTLAFRSRLRHVAPLRKLMPLPTGPTGSGTVPLLRHGLPGDSRAANSEVTDLHGQSAREEVRSPPSSEPGSAVDDHPAPRGNGIFDRDAPRAQFLATAGLDKARCVVGAVRR